MQRDTRRAILIVVAAFALSIPGVVVVWITAPDYGPLPEMLPYEVDLLDNWPNDDPNCDIRFPFESKASMTLELTPPSMPVRVPDVLLAARLPDGPQHLLPNDMEHVRLQAAGKIRVEVFIQQLYMRCETKRTYDETEPSGSGLDKRCYEGPIREETWELGILLKYPGATIVLNDWSRRLDKGSRAYSLRVCNVRGEPAPLEAESSPNAELPPQAESPLPGPHTNP